VAQAPAAVPPPHPCAYWVKLAAGVGVAGDETHNAPVACVGLPSNAEKVTWLHVVSSWNGVDGPQQLSCP
jgi:hypothetical protein